MNLDVVILAGGLGTRIAGIWEGPKCLVLVGGVPLLVRLLTMLEPLEPRTVILALGHKADMVLDWLRSTPYRSIHSQLVVVQEPQPLGTAQALRNCAGRLTAPVLVLNGDTLPRYDLQTEILAHYTQRTWVVAAFVHDESWPRRCVYAGACVLSPAALITIHADERTRDLEAHLLGVERVFVPGFLDVGTPDGFKQAQERTG